ncbi:MAG: hypothetical protein Q9222_004402 [Ikaeria aurantiellina]
MDLSPLTSKVEIGSKNHEVIPTPLILQIANLRSGSGAHKSISTLAKANLIARVKHAKYDGYRLTYGGLDYLTLHTHFQRRTLHSTGPCVGTGKESDIHIVLAPSPSSSSSPPSHKSQPPNRTSTTTKTDQEQQILKIHRLGRISFRTIKRNRDYLRHRHSCSWMHMSRLSALKEFTFMTALHESGFPVPKPMAWNRHTIVMSLIQGTPLYQISHLAIDEAKRLYAELMALIVRLAGVGLIHGDFNEFNIMVEESETAITAISIDDGSANEPTTTTAPTTTTTLNPILIDFPQMLSTSHPNASTYFARDVDCVKRYFARRFHFTSDDPGPFFADIQKHNSRENNKKSKDVRTSTSRRLDVEVEASGFSRKMARDLEKYMESVGDEGADDDEGRDSQNGSDASDNEIAEGNSDIQEPDSFFGARTPTTNSHENMVSSTISQDSSAPHNSEDEPHEGIRDPLRTLSLVEAT